MTRKKTSTLWTALFSVMLVAGLIGAGLACSRPGESIALASFDSLLLFSSKAEIDPFVIITLGEGSHRSLGQKVDSFDRAIHARLLRKLKAGGAKLVVFDIFFADPTPSDEEFARAIQEHGNVVLGAKFERLSHPRLGGRQRFDPAPLLRDLPGCRLGAVELPQDDDLAIRRFPGDLGGLTGLHWAAAEAAGVSLPGRELPPGGRWIRYYGESNSGLPAIAYEHALTADPSFFRGKTVFVGGRPETGYLGSKVDVFPTALTRWNGQSMAGVEIQATMFLNLVRREWLSRFSLGTEAAGLGAAGVLFGAALGAIRPLPGLWVAGAGMAAVWMIAVLVFWTQQIWFNWMLLAFVQIPAAWSAAAILHGRRVEREAREREAGRNFGPAGVVPEAEVTVKEADGAGTKVLIRDYELLRCVGRGAYGEVWLGRSVTGAFRAVKVVYRRNFADKRPFEREFEGVRNFEPISRTHPGWVSILHVAKEEGGSHFYYVMEPADDLSGGPIEPWTYQPKTLGALLGSRKRLAPAECVKIGIALSDALAELHGRGLVHRDIKPSNIIFIGGAPKLADIGLVSVVGESNSFVGTEGYIPPEGPGTPLADIYSFGCVLFQAATGRNSPGRGGQAPSPDEEQPDSGEMKMLLEVIDRACASFHGKRFQTATEMRDHLVRLQREMRLG